MVMIYSYLKNPLYKPEKGNLKTKTPTKKTPKKNPLKIPKNRNLTNYVIFQKSS